MMSEISVIVPVYKVEKYLARCIDSILSQTLTAFDLILVDDGSPDSSGLICDEYAAKDRRITVIHQENAGLSAARNAGIEWSFAHEECKWLTFIDSDDWIHPLYLEVLYNAVVRDNTNVSIGQLSWTYGEPLPETINLTTEVQTPHDYYLKDDVNATVAVAKLYHKTCFEGVRYPVGKLHEDEFVTYRILFNLDRVSVIDQLIYAYYQNDESIMNRKWNPSRLVRIDALEEQIQFFLDRGDDDIARQRSEALLYNMAYYQDNIYENCDLSAREKRYYLRLLRKKLRSYLIKYKDQNWVSFRNNRTLYAESSLVLSVARRIWLKIKPYVKGETLVK